MERKGVISVTIGQRLKEARLMRTNRNTSELSDHDILCRNLIWM